MVFVSDVCVEYINFIYYESKLSVTPKRLKPVKSRINNLSFAPAWFFFFFLTACLDIPSLNTFLLSALNVLGLQQLTKDTKISALMELTI